MKDYIMHENDIHIVQYLVDNPKSMGKIIAEEKKLSESEVSKRLNKLKKRRIVDNETCPSQDDKNYTGKCWYVNRDLETLHILVTKAFGSDRDSQTVFMQSHYYRRTTRDLVDRVCELMPLSDRDKDTLEDVLGISWLALKWVLHFIFETDDKRNDILQKLAGSTINPVISPAAARAGGLERGFGDGLNAASPFITDPEKMVTFVFVDGKESICFNDVMKLADRDRMVVFALEEPERFAAVSRVVDYPLARKFGKRNDDRIIKTVKPPIGWNEFFAQLTDLNENYPYLFASTTQTPEQPLDTPL